MDRSSLMPWGADARRLAFALAAIAALGCMMLMSAPPPPEPKGQVWALRWP